MIEIICREKQQEEQEIKLPKNIRQVGSPKGRHKIYMEDYVYTYLKNQAQENRKCAAVLLGKSCVSRDIRYTFISGAIECGQAVFQFDSVYLDESFWEYIYEEGKEYFPDAVIVGWFVGEQGEGMNLPAAIESAHRKYFAGRDKVLMLMDAEEEDELFYIYGQRSTCATSSSASARGCATRPPPSRPACARPWPTRWRRKAATPPRRTW